MTRPGSLDCLALAATAAAVFVLQAVAWPLHAGRDLNSYVLCYNQLNRGLGRLYPPIFVFVELGAVGALLCRHPAARPFLFLAALAAVHVCASTTLAVQYRVPFDPILITLGVAGFVRHGFGGRPAPPDPR